MGAIQSFNGVAVASFVATVVTTSVLGVGVLELLTRWKLIQCDKNETSFISQRIQSNLKKSPAQLLLVPAEDGFCLLPLLYIGLNPLTAALAAFVFAAVHYPLFPWRYCAIKGVMYFFVALFILPYGIGSVIVGHVLLDTGLFALALLLNSVTNKTFPRFFRVFESK